MTGSISLGRIGETRISIHWTFAILILWISIASNDYADFLWNFAFVCIVFLCVTLHELGHAAVANYFDIETREITLLPIGGVATLERLPVRPLSEFLISLGGPLVNFLIAGALVFSIRNAFSSGLTNALDAMNGHNFLVNVFMVNLTMGLFNLIPAFPMDGGRIFRAILSTRIDRVTATKIAARTGQALAIAAVLISLFTNQTAVSNPNLLLISLFIFFSAQSELRSFVYWSYLEGHTVGEITMKDFGRVDADEKLSAAVASLLNGSFRSFIVFADGKPVGTVNRSDLLRGLTESGNGILVKNLMHSGVQEIDIKTPIETAYNTIMNSSEAPVAITNNKKLVGVLDADNLLEFIMTRRALSARR